MSIRRIPTAIRTRRCSFCFESGHTIMCCGHVDVSYLYHEFMFFYEKYGEEFLCNNLSVLFHPHEAQALLHHPPIKHIRLSDRPRRRMVVDVMMSRENSKRYLKLHNKIISMAYLPRVYLGCMDIVEPVMNETVRIYQSIENNVTLERGTILVGYDNLFTQNRHARFRRYDYEIHYQEYLSIPLSEGLYDYPDYIPPPLIANSDFGRYGRARVIPLEDLLPTMEQNAVNTLTSFTTEVPPNVIEPQEEEEPEWLDTRPPRNVTVRHRNRHSRFLEVQENRLNNPQPLSDDVYQLLFEDWSAYSRQFEDRYKYVHTQPKEVEIEILPQPPTDCCVECPICMTDVESKETVTLGCCVYSFCGDCYSNQYRTKEQRKHQCMMCRTPFSKIQVYQDSMANKLKSQNIPQPQPNVIPNDEDDDDFSDLPPLISPEEEYTDLPMTLAELV